MLLTEILGHHKGRLSGWLEIFMIITIRVIINVYKYFKFNFVVTSIYGIDILPSSYNYLGQNCNCFLLIVFF